ncbi:reverse transcriptase family protein [Oceanospirillum beijerinckii]|uniref:reverse transcriptase family protein n=1 Tax=Oceanospirillum beijerinckii TaxID=64976 RepID=UPI0003F5AB25|nr:reverse transcriptase family protein [Oceanospirillum beijerinckii]
MYKNWNPQRYRKNANRDNISHDVIRNAIEIGNRINSVNRDIPIVFTLNHLSVLSKSKLSFLESIASRNYEDKPYRFFKIRKKGKNSNDKRRVICIPEPRLLSVQQYINEEILSKIPSHECAMAYSKGKGVYDAAELHCGCRWLIRIDLKDFFDSISERQVYYVFNKLGYPKLLSLELARICTRVYPRFIYPSEKSKWISNRSKDSGIASYTCSGNMLGSLPQGAPTSPALSNLVCKSLDGDLLLFSEQHGFLYNRYSDDLYLSTTSDLSRKDIRCFLLSVYGLLNKREFQVNKNKTVISGPKTKKLVLGLNVDKEYPKVRREVKNQIKQHLHFCLRKDIGPVIHSQKKKFSSVVGFRNHLLGMINYVNQIEPMYAIKLRKSFDRIDWPFI